MRSLADFTIGFIRPSEDPNEEPVLLGSGTLASVGKRRVILTAHHVVRHVADQVPAGGRIGLLLLPSMPRITVAMQALSLMPIARGKVDSEGPDLGAVLLSEEVAGSIAAKKRFYNLDAVRRMLLSHPPERHSGFWFVNGFPAAEAVRIADDDGDVIQFMNLNGAGGVEGPFENGEYDYYRFSVSQNCRGIAPASFGGMSGGGLWQIRLRRDGDGALESLPPLLSGIIFFQIQTEAECALLCHGRKSLYSTLYEAIETGRVR